MIVSFSDPDFMKVVAAVAAIGGPAIGYLLKSYFDAKADATKQNSTDISETKKYVEGFKDQVVGSYTKLKEAIHEQDKIRIRENAEILTQISSLAAQVNYYTERVSEMKGRMDDQGDRVAKFIATIGHMSRQLDSIFTIVEAPKRTSDLAKETQNGTEEG